MTRRPKPRRGARASAKPRGKVGGARPNSGPDPVLGPGNVRDKIKTVRLTPAEEKAQLAAAKRAGAKDWGTWIRDIANAEATVSARRAEVEGHAARAWQTIREAEATVAAERSQGAFPYGDDPE